MALSDFTIYKSDAGLTAGLYTTAPIAGAASLRMNQGTNPVTKRINMVRNVAPEGFTSGRVRYRFGVLTAEASVDIFMGVCFQQSQENLTGGAGTAYGVMLNPTGGTNEYALVVIRLSAGLTNSPTILGTSSAFILTPGAANAQAFEISWELQTAPPVEMRFLVKRGTATDFSDLITMLDFVSSTTVLQTTVGEGPALVLRTTFSSPGDYLWDTMSAVPLTLGG